MFENLQAGAKSMLDALPKKEKKPKRKKFKQVFANVTRNGNIHIFLDQETGVNYVACSPFGETHKLTGITPLIGSDGKYVITPVSDAEYDENDKGADVEK